MLRDDEDHAPYMIATSVRKTLVTAAASAVISVMLLAVFFALNRASLDLDLATAKAHIAQGFREHTLSYETHRKGDTQIGRHQYNDCLILMMAVEQHGTTAELTVSPTQVGFGDPRGICADIEHASNGDPPTTAPAFYHQYIHGQTMLMRLLLPHAQVGTIRTVYKSLIVLVLVVGIGLALYGLKRGQTNAASLFWLIIFLAFTRFFGIESFGQSFGHAPADLVFLSFALLLSIWSHRGGVSAKLAIPLMAVFGSLTVIFELLTGGIPLGLALVVGGLPFALFPGEVNQLKRNVWHGLVAFCTAVATGLIVKAVVAIVVFGTDTLAVTAGQLQLRMGLTGASGTRHGIGPFRFVKAIYKGLDSLTPGTPQLSLLALVLAIFVGQRTARKFWRTSNPLLRLQTRCLVWSNALLVSMLVAFWEHTIVHAWFMDRVLCWTIGSGFALFALSFAKINQQSPDSRVTP